MEYKTLIVSVFIMSVVIAQIQVEAKSCCPSTSARNAYNICRFGGLSRERCAKLSGCDVSKSSCTAPFIHDIPVNSGEVVNEYCKVGCVSSACSALTTFQDSDASEIVNGGIYQCAKACSTFCAMGTMTAIESA